MWFKNKKHRIVLIALAAVLAGGMGCSQEQSGSTKQASSIRPSEQEEVKVEFFLRMNAKISVKKPMPHLTQAVKRVPSRHASKQNQVWRAIPLPQYYQTDLIWVT